VEDGSFGKIREIAAGYTFGQDQLDGIGIGKQIREIKLNVSGRNLFTFTDYTGYDPEVALGNNSTYFLLDEYSYPNFSTVSGTLSVKF